MLAPCALFLGLLSVERKGLPGWLNEKWRSLLIVLLSSFCFCDSLLRRFAYYDSGQETVT